MPFALSAFDSGRVYVTEKFCQTLPLYKCTFAYYHRFVTDIVNKDL